MNNLNKMKLNKNWFDSKVFLVPMFVSAKVDTFADLCFQKSLCFSLFFPREKTGLQIEFADLHFPVFVFPSKVFVFTQRLSKTLGNAENKDFGRKHKHWEKQTLGKKHRSFEKDQTLREPVFSHKKTQICKDVPKSLCFQKDLRNTFECKDFFLDKHFRKMLQPVKHFIPLPYLAFDLKNSLFHYLVKLKNFLKFEASLGLNFSVLLLLKALYFNFILYYSSLKVLKLKQKISFAKTLRFLLKKKFYNEKLKLNMFQLKKHLISNLFVKNQLVNSILKKLNLMKTFEFNFNSIKKKCFLQKYRSSNLKTSGTKSYFNKEIKKISLKIKSLLVTIFCFFLNTNFWELKYSKSCPSAFKSFFCVSLQKSLCLHKDFRSETQVQSTRTGETFKLKRNTFELKGPGSFSKAQLLNESVFKSFSCVFESVYLKINTFEGTQTQMQSTLKRKTFENVPNKNTRNTDNIMSLYRPIMNTGYDQGFALVLHYFYDPVFFLCKHKKNTKISCKTNAKNIFENLTSWEKSARNHYFSKIEATKIIYKKLSPSYFYFQKFFKTQFQFSVFYIVKKSSSKIFLFREKLLKNIICRQKNKKNLKKFFYNLHYYFSNSKKIRLSKLLKVNFTINNAIFNYMKLEKLIRNSVNVKNNIFHLNISKFNKLYDFFYLLILSNVKNFKTKLKLKIFSETYFSQEFLNNCKPFRYLTDNELIVSKIFSNSQIIFADKFFKIWLFEATKLDFFYLKYFISGIPRSGKNWQQSFSKLPLESFFCKHQNIGTQVKNKSLANKSSRNLFLKFPTTKSVNFFYFNLKIFNKMLTKNVEIFFFDTFFFKLFRNFKLKQNFTKISKKASVWLMFCSYLKLKIFYNICFLENFDFLKIQKNNILLNFENNSQCLCFLQKSLCKHKDFRKHRSSKVFLFRVLCICVCVPFKSLCSQHFQVFVETQTQVFQSKALENGGTVANQVFLFRETLGNAGLQILFADLFFPLEKTAKNTNTFEGNTNTDLQRWPPLQIQTQEKLLKNIICKQNEIVIYSSKQNKKNFKFLTLERKKANFNTKLNLKIKYELAAFFYKKNKILKSRIVYLFQIFYFIKMTFIVNFQKDVFFFNKNFRFLTTVSSIFLNWIKKYFIFKEFSFFLINAFSKKFQSTSSSIQKISNFHDGLKLNFSGFLISYEYSVLYCAYFHNNLKLDFFVLKAYCFFQKLQTTTKLFYTFIEVAKYFNKKNVQIFLLPTYKSLKIHLELLKILTKKSQTQAQLFLISKLTLEIISWCYFYKIISNFKILNYCDNLLIRFLWKWANRLHQNKSKRWVQKKYFLSFKLININFKLNQVKNNPITQIKDLNQLNRFFKKIMYLYKVQKQTQNTKWLYSGSVSTKYFSKKNTNICSGKVFEKNFTRHVCVSKNASFKNFSLKGKTLSANRISRSAFPSVFQSLCVYTKTFEGNTNTDLQRCPPLQIPCGNQRASVLFFLPSFLPSTTWKRGNVETWKRGNVKTWKYGIVSAIPSFCVNTQTFYFRNTLKLVDRQKQKQTNLKYNKKKFKKVWVFKLISRNLKFSSRIFHLPLHIQTPLVKLNLILKKNL